MNTASDDGNRIRLDYEFHESESGSPVVDMNGIVVAVLESRAHAPGIAPYSLAIPTAVLATWEPQVPFVEPLASVGMSNSTSPKTNLDSHQPAALPTDCVEYLRSSRVYLFETLVTDATRNPASGVLPGERAREALVIEPIEATAGDIESVHGRIGEGIKFDGEMSRSIFKFTESWDDGKIEGSGYCTRAGIVGSSKIVERYRLKYFHTWDFSISK